MTGYKHEARGVRSSGTILTRALASPALFSNAFCLECLRQFPLIGGLHRAMALRASCLFSARFAYRIAMPGRWRRIAMNFCGARERRSR